MTMCIDPLNSLSRSGDDYAHYICYAYIHDLYDVTAVFRTMGHPRAFGNTHLAN
jgi:hypothetical protein